MEPALATVEALPNTPATAVVQPVPDVISDATPKPPITDIKPPLDVAVIPSDRLGGVNPYLLIGIVVAVGIVCFIVYKKTRPAPLVPVEIPNPT